MMDQFRNPIAYRLKLWGPLIFLLAVFLSAGLVRHGYGRFGASLLMLVGAGGNAWSAKRALKGGNAAIYPYLQAFRSDNPQQYWIIVSLKLLFVALCLSILAFLNWHLLPAGMRHG